MKILIQNSLFFPNVIGGAEMSSHLLGQELRRRGWAADGVATTGRVGKNSPLQTRPTADGQGVVYEAPAHGLCDIYGNDGVAEQVGFLRRGLHHFAMVQSPRWQKLFRQVLEQSRPDIVHTNTIVGMTPSIWRAAGQAGIPIVHTLRDYHLLCPRTTLLRSDKTDCTSAPLPCRILASLKLKHTHLVSIVTAPSRFVLDRHLAAGGFAEARAEVVPNACENLPEVLPDRGADGEVRGLYLGQLDEHKGLGLLLEALTLLCQDPAQRQLHFDLAGAGPWEDQVRAFCQAHPGRVAFHGVVKGQQKQDLLARASFQVVPSLWNDNFPRSILDGFSWGIPVIGTRRGGIPEVIRDGQDGLIIPAEAGALAAAMGTYVLDSGLRQKHGRSARTRAQEFTLDRQVDKFMALYRSLARGKGGSGEAAS